jgi:hypothetical protein
MNKRSFLSEAFDGGVKFKAFVEDIIHEYAEAIVLDDLDLEIERIHRRENRTKKKDYWTKTTWGRMLSNPGLSNPRCGIAKKFRRRFRVPYPLFRDVLVRECLDHNTFGIKDPVRVRVPLEFKILAALRILGRGNCADDIEEFSDIPESTCFAIFKTFVTKFSVKLSSKYI